MNNNNALDEIINEKLETLLVTEPVEAAEAAGLRYVTDEEAGSSRFNISMKREAARL